MHFKQISLISLAIAFAAASPVQTNPKELHAREHNKGRFINPQDPKLSLDEQCMWKRGGLDLFNYWNVVINDASDYTDDTCGSGFLDNINGRGCAVTGWGCHYANDGKTMNAGFKAPTTCTHDDINSAINAAFGGKKVGCANYDKV
ncbi:hypothetical protein N7491_006641 [Penicillium cf. griseofulvum]|uniref:Uncharacterized protein n=1 Tax=Penicillium cf. griseofulvum TaxID=2972120 RepID=A0A9W9IWC1_9EURO|nr:hypothetical protein N7472_010333 [Penicillium cf. griseofulvum]KAJ5429625.1 hypothetical protein N7491_006641 [Penicillium cf. griseofulvum]KAJ5436609.1 hypothetical protein N7445_007494 [Penicillium cf. griseofulvum]